MKIDKECPKCKGMHWINISEIDGIKRAVCKICGQIVYERFHIAESLENLKNQVELCIQNVILLHEKKISIEESRERYIVKTNAFLGWKDSNKELPKEKEDVLIFTVLGNIVIGYWTYDKKGEKYWFRTGIPYPQEDEIYASRFWMPLPEAPRC